MIKNTKKDEKPMSDQSVLWGVSTSVLDAWGLRLMIAGGAFGAIALVLSLASSYVLYRVAEIASEDSRVAIATANREAANANERTELLKARYAWREVPTDASRGLLTRLSSVTGAVTIEFVMNDPEAHQYAFDFGEVFRSAGWEVSLSGRSLPSVLVTGVHIPQSNSPFLDTVRAAFRDAEIDFSEQEIPRVGMTMGGGIIPNSATIFIGAKPRPVL